MAAVELIHPRRDAPLLVLIVVMSVVTAGYPSYLVHPVTLLAPVPLLVALLLLDDARFTSPIWIGLVGAMAVWTVLLYLAMTGRVNGLVYSLSMYLPFAALAFRIRRPEPVALTFAVITSTLVSIRAVASFVHSGADLVPWEVYEGNQLAAELTVLLPLVIVAGLALPAEWRKTRLLLAAVVVGGLVSIVVNLGRAGLGALVILLLLGLARTSWRTLLVVGVAGLAAAAVMSSSIVSLLERIRFVHFVPSNASRPEIWSVATDALRRTAWLGVGPGNSGEALRQVGGGHAHNNLVQTALETGWPGALLMAGLTVYLIVLAARLLWRGGDGTLWALSLIGYVLYSIVSSPIQRPDFTLALVLVVLVAREHPGTRGEQWTQ